MRISRVHAPVTVLGPGRRVGVWTQGCTLACAGCASRDTWDPTGGSEVSVSDLLATVLDLGADCDGLTISGGEPLEQPAELARFLRAIRVAPLPRARRWDVLLFTGLTPAEWTQDQRDAAELADAAVAGRYHPAQPSDAPLRASGNQELLVLSPLGAQRYDPGERAGAVRELQVVLDGRGLTLIGLPRPRDLGRMERALRQRGVRLSEVSWRS